MTKINPVYAVYKKSMTNMFVNVVTDLIAQSLRDTISLRQSLKTRKLLLYLRFEIFHFNWALENAWKYSYYGTYLFLLLRVCSTDLAQETTLDKTCLLTVLKMCIFLLWLSEHSLRILFEFLYYIFHVSVIDIFLSRNRRGSFASWLALVNARCLLETSDLFEIKEV